MEQKSLHCDKDGPYRLHRRATNISTGVWWGRGGTNMPLWRSRLNFLQGMRTAESGFSTAPWALGQK